MRLRFRLLVAGALAVGGCGGNVASEPTTFVPVAGNVHDWYDQPLAGARVMIGGEVQTTDAAGSFAFARVAKPYDLVVVAPPAPNTAPKVRELLGMTSTAPSIRLQVIGAAPPPAPPVACDHRATITMATPSSGTVVHWAAALVADGAVRGSVMADPAGFGSSTACWSGPADATVSLVTAQYPASGGSAPAEAPPIVQLGTKSLHDGATLALTSDLGAPRVPVRDIAVRVATSDVSVTPSTFLTVLVAPGLSVQIPGTSHVFAPEIASAQYTLQVLAMTADGFTSTTSAKLGSVDDLQAQSFSLLRPPVLTAPAAGASGAPVDGPFQFQTAGAGLADLALTPAGGDASLPTYAISVSAADSNTVRLPSLAPLGLSTGAGAPYTWSVAWTSAPQHVDDVAGTIGIAPPTGGSVAQSKEADFTFAP